MRWRLWSRSSFRMSWIGVLGNRIGIGVRFRNLTATLKPNTISYPETQTLTPKPNTIPVLKPDPYPHLESRPRHPSRNPTLTLIPKPDLAPSTHPKTQPQHQFRNLIPDCLETRPETPPTPTPILNLDLIPNHKTRLRPTSRYSTPILGS